MVEIAGRDVQRNGGLFARRVACALDGLHEERQDGFVAVEVGPEAALVGQAQILIALLENVAGRVIDIVGDLQCLSIGASAGGDQQEILDIGAPVGMSAAADDLDLGQRQQRAVALAEDFIERLPLSVGHGIHSGHGDAQDGVGAEISLVVGAVQIDHDLIDGSLIRCVAAQ